MKEKNEKVERFDKERKSGEKIERGKHSNMNLVDSSLLPSPLPAAVDDGRAVHHSTPAADLVAAVVDWKEKKGRKEKKRIQKQMHRTKKT